MFGKRSLALSAALSMLALGSPSYAFDFDTLLRNYLGGTALPVVTNEQAELKTSINTRQAQLETEIEAGVRSGQLTTTEERDLRNALNHVAFLEGTALADGNLNAGETQGLVEDLTTVSRRLNAYLTNNTVTGFAATTTGVPASTSLSSWLQRYVGTGGGDTVVSNQAAVQAILDTRQAQLDGAVEEAMINGTLTWDDAHSLRTELTRIQTNESSMLADGRLTISEEQQLVAQLNSLDSLLKARVTTQVSVNSPRGNAYGRRGRSVNRMQSALRRRIDRGVSTGKLTRQEADRLLAQEAQVRQLELQLRTSGRRLTYSEENRLLARLDRLSENLNKQLTDRQIW